jgi:hypothetical protein
MEGCSDTHFNEIQKRGQERRHFTDNQKEGLFSPPRLAFRHQLLAIQTSHTVPLAACYLRAA